MNRNTIRTFFALALALVLLAGCGKKKKEVSLDASAEPDKVLYERAMKDLEGGKHVIARLTLQTLINTYPDSEYLAKAKLAVADSFFKEGGSAGLTQAVAEYKDFKVFFPQTEEAPYAQMQVGMSHYRRMEKPDRDRTYARLAEDELQRFIGEYPNHALTAQAKQRLREVQEVLAEGDYRIARYYFIKGSIRAAGGRLLELVDRYPLYSNADRALWMLGQAFEKSEKGDVASRYYSRIVKDYPLSELVPDAKGRLEALGVPIPQPDPAALERQQQAMNSPEGQKRGIFSNTVGRAFGMISTRPDVSHAATTGEPQMNPPAEPGGDTAVLTPGGTSGLTVTGGTVGASNTATAEGVPGTGSSTSSSNSAPASGTANATELAKVDPEKAKKAKKKEEEEKKRKEKLEESSSKKKKKN